MAQISVGLLSVILLQPREALLEVSVPNEWFLLEHGTEMILLQPLAAEDSPHFVLSC